MKLNNRVKLKVALLLVAAMAAIGDSSPAAQVPAAGDQIGVNGNPVGAEVEDNLATASAATAAFQPQTDPVTSDLVIDGLSFATDFSVAPDGETVFVAEVSQQRIRRFAGGESLTVVAEINEPDNRPESICVHAINQHRILVGVKGFQSPRRTVTFYDTLEAGEQPLMFADQQIPPNRSFERILKRSDSFDVLKMFQQARGIALVQQFKDRPPRVSEIRFKGGVLNLISSDSFESSMGQYADLSTLGVEGMGGYLIAKSAAGIGIANRSNDQHIDQEENAARQTRSSRLVFMQGDGRVMQTYETDLDDIVDVACSPTNNRLYIIGWRYPSIADSGVAGAAKRSGHGTESDGGNDRQSEKADVGIFELTTAAGDLTKYRCRSKLVFAVPRPVALKFDSSGRAWVLSQSTADSRDGRLYRIGGLDLPQNRKK